MRKFFKTVITVTVLTEDGPVSPEANLDTIARQIMEGDWSGEVDSDGGTELTAKEAAEALIAQGSDPEFFRINADGNMLDEDGNPENQDE
jgi:hypothetical protein